MAAEERIGLFGGTFNPIHLGHLRAARTVEEAFSLGQVLFIPSYIPPHKAAVDIASPEDRLKMVELAVAGIPRFRASALEVEARERSYSILTLEKIKTVFPGSPIFFILGADAFLEIETWRDYERVLFQCSFIVISRPGYEVERARDVLGGRFREETFAVPPEGGLDNRTLGTFRIFLLKIDALDISSTEIRKRVKSGGSLEGLVPPEVEAYMRRKRLYR
jgi:nicotinate-nucleotide adenylyltransferase